jgi:hypothetical protein
MTDGLGKAQRLILDTLAAIECERGPGAWRLSDLLKEAYRRSPLLQAKVAAGITAKKESRDRMRRAAESGDIDAVRSYALSLINDGWPTPRPYSYEASAGTIAKHLNPSKIVARLARRGLVWRTRGTVGLTDAGRAASFLDVDAVSPAKFLIGNGEQ